MTAVQLPLPQPFPITWPRNSAELLVAIKEYKRRRAARAHQAGGEGGEG